jgi:hypothetical protein
MMQALRRKEMKFVDSSKTKTPVDDRDKSALDYFQTLSFLFFSQSETSSWKATYNPYP